jgi:hypothetical protein
MITSKKNTSIVPSHNLEHIRIEITEFFQLSSPYFYNWLNIENWKLKNILIVNNDIKFLINNNPYLLSMYPDLLYIGKSEDLKIPIIGFAL